jgi:hypothetical protein
MPQTQAVHNEEVGKISEHAHEQASVSHTHSEKLSGQELMKDSVEKAREHAEHVKELLKGEK